MIEMQREQFVAPVREQVYEPAAFQYMIQIEIEHLGNAATSNTGFQMCQCVIHNELPFDLDRDALLTVMEFPWKGLASGSVAEKQTFVILGL